MKAGLIAALFAAAFSAQPPAGWTPEISIEVRPVADVTPSPDGRLAVYTESRAVIETAKSEIDTQIFLAAADGSHRTQLTRGEKSAADPSFSPDGRFVYFSSARSGKPNLWRIRVDGGDAEMLTDWKGAMGPYHVSPDGRWVAFAGRAPSPADEKARQEKLDFHVLDGNPQNFSLWIIPAEPDARGNRPPRRIADIPGHVVDFDWSPDSRFIAFTHTPAPSFDDLIRADISEVDVSTGAVRPIAVTGAAERDPHYSPDGRYLAYVRSADPGRWVGMDRIVLLTRDTGDSRELPRTFDEQPVMLGWSSDSARVLFAEYRGFTRVIYGMPLDGPAQPAYEMESGTLQPGHLNTAGTVLGFERESAQRAPEAYLLKLDDHSARQVGDANAELPKLPMGETKPITWKSTDGMDIEGLLTYPVGFEAGKKYPLVLVVHGGPAGEFQDSFLGRSGAYPLAAFAARGYAVLRANPRGSSGYGRTFRFAILNDWGGKDYEDLMAGVDHVIGMGVADPDRLAVMGWSYGGYMTSWIITHTHRFKAASIGAGITDLWSFTGTTDIPGFLPDYFGGEPWNNFDGYYNRSPLAFVKGVTTPALILHGEADVRVPASQGYEFYNALKRQGVPTEMVVYPRMGHEPREPKFLLDMMQRNLAWIARYVGP